MGEADNIPGNANTNGYIDLNNGGWILIAVLIAVIIITFIIAIFINVKKQNEINELKKSANQNINENELNLLLKYRKLSDKNKTAINTMLKSLCDNDKTDTE